MGFFCRGRRKGKFGRIFCTISPSPSLLLISAGRKGKSVPLSALAGSRKFPKRGGRSQRVSGANDFFSLSSFRWIRKKGEKGFFAIFSGGKCNCSFLVFNFVRMLQTGSVIDKQRGFSSGSKTGPRLPPPPDISSCPPRDFRYRAKWKTEEKRVESGRGSGE